MNPRRILLVNWNDTKNPWTGGAEIHLHEVFRRLAARGDEVTFLCSGFPGGAPEERIDGMRILRVAGRWTFHLAAAHEIRRLTSTHRFDIVIEALNKIPIMTPLYTRLPILGIGHHLFGATIFREAPPPFSLIVAAHELCVPWVYRGVPMIVISESTKEDFVMRGLCEDRIRVSYVGVDHEAYSPDPRAVREERPTLLALGRVRRYKRLDLAIDAVAELARGKYPDLRLIVAGTGNHLEALRKHAQKRGVADRVEFLGRVEEAEKTNLYRRAWALVMTSPKEGWGLTCLEAQACGTPVIASDSPGLREAVLRDRSGLLVPHANLAGLRSAIDRLLKDPELRERLAAGALEYASRFTWERCADEMSDMIDSTISKREAA